MPLSAPPVLSTIPRLAEERAVGEPNNALTPAIVDEHDGDENENENACTSSDVLFTPLYQSCLRKKPKSRKLLTPSKLKEDEVMLAEDKEVSPDPLRLARRNNTALARLRSQREQSLRVLADSRKGVGFLDRLVGLQERYIAPVSGLTIALQGLSQDQSPAAANKRSPLASLQQREPNPVMPETPKAVVFEPSPEMPKWSSTTGNDGYMQQLAPSSLVKSSRLSDAESLSNVSMSSQRAGGYRYEKMNCDLGFRFDRPIALGSNNLFNTDVSQSSYPSQSPSKKLSIPTRRITLALR